MRYEAADGALFPHLYGPLNTEAVVAVHTLQRGPDGNYKASSVTLERRHQCATCVMVYAMAKVEEIVALLRGGER